jgi:hypothetical protein
MDRPERSPRVSFDGDRQLIQCGTIGRLQIRGAQPAQRLTEGYHEILSQELSQSRTAFTGVGSLNDPH